MASKRAVYKALSDFVSSLALSLVEHDIKTAWAKNKLTLIPEGESGLFAFITYDTKTASAAMAALESAGLLGKQDLGELGVPPSELEACEGCGLPVLRHESGTTAGGPRSVRCSIKVNGDICCAHLPPKLGDLRG